LIGNGKHRSRVKKRDGPRSQAIDVAAYWHVTDMPWHAWVSVSHQGGETLTGFVVVERLAAMSTGVAAGVINFVGKRKRPRWLF
jgi:hypothetical protein